jgi:hypothetical protein
MEGSIFFIIIRSVKDVTSFDLHTSSNVNV